MFSTFDWETPTEIGWRKWRGHPHDWFYGVALLHNNTKQRYNLTRHQYVSEYMVQKILLERLTPMFTEKVIIAYRPWFSKSVEFIDPLLGDEKLHQTRLQKRWTKLYTNLHEGFERIVFLWYIDTRHTNNIDQMTHIDTPTSLASISCMAFCLSGIMSSFLFLTKKQHKIRQYSQNLNKAFFNLKKKVWIKKIWAPKDKMFNFRSTRSWTLME